MSMLELLIGNPITYLIVIIFSFIIYVFYHIAMIERFMRQHKLNLGFFDKLLLFRLPTWQPNAQINNATLSAARRMARQFVLAVCICIVFYVVAYFITMELIAK